MAVLPQPLSGQGCAAWRVGAALRAGSVEVRQALLGWSAAARAWRERGTWRARHRRRQCTTRWRRQKVRGFGSQVTVTRAPPGASVTVQVQMVNDGLPSSLTERWTKRRVCGSQCEDAGSAGPGHAPGAHLDDPFRAGHEFVWSFEHGGELGVPVREAVDVGEQGEHLVGVRADQDAGGGVGGVGVVCAGHAATVGTRRCAVVRSSPYGSCGSSGSRVRRSPCCIA